MLVELGVEMAKYPQVAVGNRLYLGWYTSIDLLVSPYVLPEDGLNSWLQRFDLAMKHCGVATLCFSVLVLTVPSLVRHSTCIQLPEYLF